MGLSSFDCIFGVKVVRWIIRLETGGGGYISLFKLELGLWIALRKAAYFNDIVSSAAIFWSFFTAFRSWELHCA